MIIASIADRSTYEFRGEDIARSSVTIAQQTNSIIQLGRSSYLLVGCLVRRCFYGTELVANVVMPILVSTEREVAPATTSLILAEFVKCLEALLTQGDPTGIYWQSFNLTPIPTNTSIVPDKTPWFAVCRTES